MVHEKDTHGARNDRALSIPLAAIRQHIGLSISPQSQAIAVCIDGRTGDPILYVWVTDWTLDPYAKP